MAAFAAQAYVKLEQFRPQELANIINAFSRLAYAPSEAFLAKFVQCCDRVLDGFKPQVGGGAPHRYRTPTHRYCPWHTT
jgi:hypothetical protein